MNGSVRRCCFSLLSHRRPSGGVHHPMSTSTSATAARGPAEIAELVRRRVRERDAWLVDGRKEPHATLGEALRFMGGAIPKMMCFRVDEAELDRTFPVRSLDWERLRTPPREDEIRLTWLGHSSLLVQMGGRNIVTDPVFSERCSPSQWFGPKRYRPAPCSVEELCAHVPIDLVLVSHNHYDHLDLQSVCDFVNHSVAAFVVPLGLAGWFRLHVSSALELHELDWHETVDCGDAVRVTSLPMRHWSNRTGDRDQTLWCGFSVESRRGAIRRRFLFPGDTAWFDELEQLGELYGPFDVAALPIGAYEPREFMKHNHTDVDEAVRMKDAVRAAHAVPIHWGTFPLTLEPVMEPREKLMEIMARRKDTASFAPWLIGETKSF